MKYCDDDSLTLKDAQLDTLAALKLLEDGTEEHSREVTDCIAFTKAMQEAEREWEELRWKKREKAIDVACGAVREVFHASVFFGLKYLSARIEFGPNFWRDPTGGTPTTSSFSRSVDKDVSSWITNLFRR